jgi:hypothetical protein
MRPSAPRRLESSIKKAFEARQIFVKNNPMQSRDSARLPIAIEFPIA